MTLVGGPAGEQRQARGGCLADLVLTGEEAGDQPGGYKYTFATASSLRTGSTQPASQSLQQASSCRQHRAHHPRVGGWPMLDWLFASLCSSPGVLPRQTHAMRLKARHQSLAD